MNLLLSSKGANVFYDSPDKTLDKLTLPGALIRSKDVKDAGIHGSFLQRMVYEGKLKRCGRGLYVRTDMDPDEFLFYQTKYSKGIYSNETALFLHGYLEERPPVLTMTFPQGYHAESLNYGNLYAKHIVTRNLELGAEETKTPKGNTVTAYNIERSLCDLLRDKRKDYEIFETVLEKYLDSENKNLVLLEEYSKRLRVHSKLRPFLIKYFEKSDSAF